MESAAEPSCKRPRIAARDDDITLLRPRVAEDDITVLYTPSLEVDPIADIIFVHGLQGHPRKTWEANAETPSTGGKRSFFGLRKRRHSECEKSSDEMFWPIDILPNDYKNMRILTYGYDSKVSHYFGGPANKLNLSQLGEGLLNRVVGERRRSKAGGRPIVFVAHSLGGLLVKEALVESKKQGPSSHKIDVYKSTQGIVFFGTPHKGSNDAKWGIILQSIASAAFDTNDKLIRTLEPDNELLDKLVRDFQDIIDEGKLKICSLLESAGKTGLPIFNGKVVPDSSASLGSRKFEHQDYIEKNHMNMCRFTRKDDGGYNRFRDGLDFCVDQMGCSIENNTREDLLQSLQYDEMLAREAQLTDANVTTLDWVWRFPSNLPSWLETGTGIFWIQGKPGSGKSTLMNYLKGHSQTKQYFARAHCQELITIRFFFDFRAHSSTSNNFDGLLRALLFQLTLDIPQLSSSIAEFGKLEIWQPTAQQEFFWTTTKLRQALLSALQNCTTNILMLIDGVDELEGASRNMLDMIEFFQEVTNFDNERRHIKICIASRPHPLMVITFGPSSGFKLQDRNNKGIKNYIDCRLKIASQVPQKPAFEFNLTKFAEEILRRSHGVFLWARFAVDEILVGRAEGEDEREIWARLQTLPDELEEIYDRIVKRTISSCGSFEETSIMLQIAHFTLRSLKLQEFFRVLQLALGRSLLDKSFCPKEFENKIRAKTGGLVEVVVSEEELDGEVKLIHETVQTYLDRQNKGTNIDFRLKKVGVAGKEARVMDTTSASQTLSHQRSPLHQTIHLNEPPRRMADDIFSPAEKVKTGREGRVGTEERSWRSCIRCRVQRIRCRRLIPNDHCCEPCQRVAATRSLPVFCIEYTVESCLLNQYDCTILDWPETPQCEENPILTKQIITCDKRESITLALKKSYGPPLAIDIHALVFEDKLDGLAAEDVLWSELGIQSLEQATLTAKAWIDQCIHACIESMLQNADQITVLCFRAAQAEEKHTPLLITNAIRLLTIARILQDDWQICNPQIANHLFHLPRIFRYQLEAILQLQFFEPLRKECVHDLRIVLLNGRGEGWATAFLTIFILLHICDFEIARYRNSCSKKHAQKIQCPSSDRRSVIEATGQNLLAHFHVCCKAGRLFSDDKNFVTHNEATKELIVSLRAIILEADKKMSKYSNAENYNGKSWFTGQMFVSDWVPTPSFLDYCKKPRGT